MGHVRSWSQCDNDNLILLDEAMDLQKTWNTISKIHENNVHQTSAGLKILKLYIEKLYSFGLQEILFQKPEFLTPQYLHEIGYFDKLHINVIIFDKSLSDTIIYKSPTIKEHFMSVFMIG